MNDIQTEQIEEPTTAINKYSNTVIYKISCVDPSITDIYVGSTTNIKKRLASHKTNSIASNYTLYQFIRDNKGWSNFRMDILEVYPCLSRSEATQRERFYVESLHATLNKNIPSRSTREFQKYYYSLAENKQKHSEYCQGEAM